VTTALLRSPTRLDRLGRIALLVAPALWVFGVLGLSFALGDRSCLLPLLAAAPAVACVSTDRHKCVALGCVCALAALALIPGDSAGSGERLGTALAVFFVAVASCLVLRRRAGLQRSFEELRRIADVTQRTLLRPVPERIGPVAAAVAYLAAASGARVGGDFYEVIETPYGLRVILGDVRGNGLDAVGGAAALLGAFREAGAVEPELAAVAVRLDAALTRYATALRPARYDAEPDLRSEDFATAVLAQIAVAEPGCHPAGSVDVVLPKGRLNRAVPLCANPMGFDLASIDSVAFDAGAFDAVGINSVGIDSAGFESSSAAPSAGPQVELVVCGHPAPYLVRPGQARLLAAEEPAPPLGMRVLASGAVAVASYTASFEPGESLVFYTDGITDARDRSGVFFPLDEVLADAPGIDPEELAGAVRERLIAHTQGAPRDDAAVLVLRRLGVPASPSLRVPTVY
jgi:Stage II sporulation protein E (SpoIIE)